MENPETEIKSTNPKSFYREHFGAIITAIVALAAVFVSYFQYKHSSHQTVYQQLITERTYISDSLRNEKEFEEKKRQYHDLRRIEMAKFVSENKANLFSPKEGERDLFIRLLTETFGEESLYLRALLSRPAITKNTEPVLDKEDVETLTETIYRITTHKINELYKPLSEYISLGKGYYNNYRKSNYSYGTAKIIADYNHQMRKLLITKNDLIPAYLESDAQKLVEHLTLWITAFKEKERESMPQNDDDSFRVQYKGKRFPELSAQRFVNEYLKLQNVKAKSG